MWKKKEKHQVHPSKYQFGRKLKKNILSKISSLFFCWIMARQDLTLISSYKSRN